MTFDWQLDQYPKGVTPPRRGCARQAPHRPHVARRAEDVQRNATLPLVPFVAASLEAWQASTEPNRYGLVWTHKGQPIRDHIDRAEWHAIQSAAGVSHPDGRPWHLHETRHTAASVMINLGEDPRTIAAILGQTKLMILRPRRGTPPSARWDGSLRRSGSEASPRCSRGGLQADDVGDGLAVLLGARLCGAPERGVDADDTVWGLGLVGHRVQPTQMNTLNWAARLARQCSRRQRLVPDTSYTRLWRCRHRVPLGTSPLVPP